MKKRLILAAAILVTAVGIGGFFVARQLAYARVERLTEIHAHEFRIVATQINAKYEAAEASVDYLKVFGYAPYEAKLLATIQFENGNRHGVYVYLVREAGEWHIA